MIHTYIFGKNPSRSDFRMICKIIVKDCPGYALSERESIEGKTETVRLTNGEREIRAEFERDKGTVTVYSEEQLPNLYKLSKRWETAGGIRRRLCFFGYILTGSPARVKFIFLPLLLFSAAFLGGFAKDGSAASGALTGLSDILTALKGLIINWSFFGWSVLIPMGAALKALANRQEKPSENERELSGGNKKGLLKKLRAFIKREADFMILLALAALPALCTGCASYRLSVYNRFCYEAEIIKSNPLYAPLAVFMAALPYLIIGEIVFSGMGKRKKRPSARAAALLGLCSVMAALTVTVKFSDLYTGFDNIRYEAEYELHSNAGKLYSEAMTERIPTEYADEFNDIAEYALANNYFDWTECPDESLEKQWEKIFLEGRAAYRVRAEGNSIVFSIRETEYKTASLTGGNEPNEN